MVCPDGLPGWSARLVCLDGLPGLSLLSAVVVCWGGMLGRSVGSVVGRGGVNWFWLLSGFGIVLCCSPGLVVAVVMVWGLVLGWIVGLDGLAGWFGWMVGLMVRAGCWV